MDRLLANTAGTASLSVTDVSGAPLGLDAPPSVTVADGGGTTLFTATATSPSTGNYQIDVPSTATARMDTLTLTWTSTLSGSPASFTTYLDVVSGDPITVAEIRAGSKSLLDTSKFPDADVLRARDEAVAVFENELGFGVVGQGERVTLSGSGTDTLLLPHTKPIVIYSATDNGVAIDLSTVQLRPWGAAVIPWGYWPSPISNVSPFSNISRTNSFMNVENISIWYAHGWMSVPADAKRALRILSTAYLIPSALDPRASSVNTDVGTFRITLAGRDGPTGIPEVDAVLDRYRTIPAAGFA